MPREPFDWSLITEGTTIPELTEEEQKKLDNIVSQINVLNGLTPNSSFGHDLIMRTIQTFHAEDAETLISKVELNTLKKARPGRPDNTPIGKLLRGRR